MTSGSYLQSIFSQAGSMATGAKAAMRSTRQSSQILQAMRDNPGLARVAAIGSNKWMGRAGWGLLGVGAVFTLWSNYQSTHGDIPLAAAETVADTTVVVGATKLGATLGMWVGTSIAPGPGTFIGGAIGAGAGAVGGILASGPLNNVMSRGWKSVKGWFS
ncbi:hypothetical protein [Streptomyces sp. YIM S03343]